MMVQRTTMLMLEMMQTLAMASNIMKETG